MLILLSLIYIIVSIYKLKRIPESISETSYLWNKINWFTIYCMSIVGTIIIPWIDMTPSSYQFLCFLSCVGILMAGSTPLFKEKFEGTVHYAGGILAMLGWIIWAIISGYWGVLILDAIITAILSIIKPRCWVFWAEIVAILTLGILLI